MYIRYGEIPENEKSVNFIKMKFVENEDFTYFMECGDSREVAWRHASKRPFENVLEEGVSVFEAIGETPKADTEKLQRTLSALEDEHRPVYLVDGKQIGIGQDGEPLIIHVKIIKRLRN